MKKIFLPALLLIALALVVTGQAQADSNKFDNNHKPGIHQSHGPDGKHWSNNKPHHREFNQKRHVASHDRRDHKYHGSHHGKPGPDHRRPHHGPVRETKVVQRVERQVVYVPTNDNQPSSSISVSMAGEGFEFGVSVGRND
ncbi:MAG: hypothetical protein LBS44_00145 [Deltaproteobacteria bacterium]|jgi:hypothetical protein|nr:hypothetical protein [Deltaproteobacteria bacterium]